MNKSDLILSFLWLLYCLFHSLLANKRLKNFFSIHLGLTSAVYRISYNAIALSLLCVLILIHSRVNSSIVYQTNWISDTIAVILGLTGIIIMLLCIVKYFKQMSGLQPESKTDKLQTGGIHKWVRHPLYFGTILFLVAISVYWPMVKNILVFGIIILYTLAGIWLEEKKLVLQFGDAYLKYKEQVPMIIPRLKARIK